VLTKEEEEKEIKHFKNLVPRWLVLDLMTKKVMVHISEQHLFSKSWFL